MPTVKEINPKATPHLFYLPRMTPHPAWQADTLYAAEALVSEGNFEYKAIEEHTSSSLFGDDLLKWEKIGHVPYTDTEDPFEDHPVYDIGFEEDSTVSNGKGIKRRGKSKVVDGIQIPTDQVANARFETITGKDHFFIDLYYDGVLVATQELQPQYYQNGWKNQEIEGTVAIENEVGKMTCSSVQGGFAWDVEINFSPDNSKWSWNVTVPSILIRLAWIIEFTALGQQMLADGDLTLNISDYTGNLSDDEGVETRTILFEPDGIDASSGWVVDPYLTVDEQSTYIDVLCDGVTFRHMTNGDYRLALIYTGGSYRASVLAALRPTSVAQDFYVND